MNHKPLPIGIDNFEKLISKGYYYVDKSLFIKELIDNMSEVSLFTRPRRFGKSLNMSMLQHFFEIRRDSTPLFKNLKIMSAGEKYVSHMNQYPVINLTFKASGKLNFKSSIDKLKDELIREFGRHQYLLDDNTLNNYRKEHFQKILSKSASVDDYSGSLRFLSDCLEQHHNKKVIILLDEYDVPLGNAFFNGFYEEMIDFIRSLLGDALKTNPSLEFAVLTGCLRISKESIFTGLNNLDVISILSDNYGEYYGFTEEELKDALSYYHLESKAEEAERWYNGYLFGNTNVYNPWSVIHFIKDSLVNIKCKPKSYWSNTSSNNIIRTLIEKSGKEEKDEIETLISGGKIVVPIHEDVTYEDIDTSMKNLWNFLFFTGYLKKVDETYENENLIFTLSIPNHEVLTIYKRKIREWFDEKIKMSNLSEFMNAILEKDTEKLMGELNIRLSNTISFYDTAENFYHGFLLGILSNIDNYMVKSNRESGLGRSDIFLKSTGIEKKAAIFECKVLKENDDAEEKCQEALQQINDKRYDAELIQLGYKEIIKYGIVFRGKQCMIIAE